jgi:cytochrome b subunit of formate dehydrogenase
MSSVAWGIFTVMAVLAVTGVILWIRFLPKYRNYKKKAGLLNSVNQKYIALCKQRKDLVYHFYWAVDRVEMKEADFHEQEVLKIDKELESLRTKFKDIEQTSVL